ncbi:Signal transduction histidine kinase [Duganella sacchari]|uniref:histidine kinase n=1 Tax=Duganella sacchari TaxID=551987 RepID=A0A1M7Q7N9_9BURK|nr:sensor histidine kinase [Duganella sacchari]SHN26516.1 Signal transduction histidine kinase [Duganella sacchari]
MKLSAFILENLEPILNEWESFAASLAPLEDATKVELRDHAAAVLHVIAKDLDTPQAEHQSIAKSKGLALAANGNTAAQLHAEERVAAGFSGEQVMAEYRALRSSVLRLWALDAAITTPSDIQDMIRFNESIDQAQTESMARYSRMLREAQNLFLAILGHDVRTPLGAVSMGAQVLLMDQTLPSKALKVGLRILNSSKRMDAIVRDLLDFSTTHLGEGIPIDPRTVDLLEICQHTIDEAKTFHPDRKFEMTSEGILTGAWDGQRMGQAFSNLISNAIQHSTPESIIRVSISGFIDEVVYEVQNDAEMFSQTKLRTLFDPIKRFAIRPASERVGTRMQNLGLGLYVVKEIVNAHDGEISVASTKDGGVTFTVRLPRQVPHRRSGDC